MGKLHEVADKAAAKAKRVVAEIVGDGKLDDEARRQEKAAEDRRDEDRHDGDSTTDLSRITNNLT